MTDRSEIIRALRLILQPGQVTELRALDATTARDHWQPHTESGYFDDLDKLAAAAATITSAKGIYFIPNVVKPPLLARAANRIRNPKKAPTTSDKDIVARRWLLIDCDATRPSEISSTDAEHQAALDMARQIRDALTADGWPQPLMADSGNGAHLLYPIDEPADDGGLVKGCLEALAARFDTPEVKVDQTVFNPARIWKLYGTLACKGDDTPDRPHRMAKIIDAPDTITVVATSLLEALAAGAKPVATKAVTPSASGQSWIENWIKAHHVPVDAPEPWQGGRRWVFPTCPWNPDHTNRSAYIVQHATGPLGAGCHHDGCKDKDWKALRDLFEPDRKGTDTPRVAPRFTPIVTRLADVEPEDISWLWPGRIALGKLSLLFGDPGLGKSFISLDLASRISRGTLWPDDRHSHAPLGSVVLLSAEDGLADTVRPRLDKMGADVSKIVALSAVMDDKTQRPVSLQTDVPALAEAIEQVGDCRLVIIDPISAYCGGGKLDSNNNTDVRGLLLPLSDLATKYKVAVLMVSHQNKNERGAAIYRATGSLAFIAAARAAWLVKKDKADPARRLLGEVKNNLASSMGMAFTINRENGRVEWESAPVDVSVDADKTHKLADDAAPWLHRTLSAGPVPSAELYERAEQEEGYSEKQLRTAKKKIGATVRKNGFSGGWEWVLDAKAPEGAQYTPSTTKGALGAFEHTPITAA